MSKVLINPSIPLWHGIPGGLKVGTMVEIRGKVPYGADVFQINFTSGQDVGSRHANRIFHMSVRFPIQKIVRNSQIDGEWGDEEKEGRFPFSSGKSFFILILVESACYKVAVDGQHCFEYFHRFEHTSATFFYVDGSVKIDEVQFFNLPAPTPGGCIIPPQPSIYPAPTPGGCIIPPQPSIYPDPSIGTCIPPQQFPSRGALNQTVYKPTIPFSYPLPQGLIPGMSIYIQGRPSASVSRFSINLQCGTGPYPPPDIAFHVDVRHYNSTVVRNTRMDNQWGTEERQIPNFPFQPAVNFDMIIRVDHDKYVLTVNGIHFADYRHRILPLSRVNTLFIENDVVVNTIRFQ